MKNFIDLFSGLKRAHGCTYVEKKGADGTKIKGKSFVKRFDANSYLYITRAMDYFDVTKLFPHSIKMNTDLNKHINFLIISFTSDWLFPTKENLQIVEILNRHNCKVSFTEINTDKGHDSFLLNEPELDRCILGFLNSNFNNIVEKNI